MKTYGTEHLLKMRRILYFLFIFGFLITGTGCESEPVDETGTETTPPDEPEDPDNPEEPEEPKLGPPIVPQEGDFTIAVIPDTQYYSSHPELGGNPEMFYSQIEWIKKNQKKKNIVYVAHLGDITNDGDQPATANHQWEVATTAMYGLEYPKSIPYGVAVGNHDQFPWGYALTSTTINYNQYFGTEHFEGRAYYGGNFDDNNDNHYDLFSAGGLDFIVVYIEYDRKLHNPAAIEWADDIVSEFSDRKAIIVSHFIINNNGTRGTNSGRPGKFSPQGAAIYEELKDNENVFMMLCGHVAGNGEGFRADTYRDNTIRTFLSDYQGRQNGGNGLMRTYEISVENNQISVETFSPYADISETDGDSQFTAPLFDQ